MYRWMAVFFGAAAWLPGVRADRLEVHNDLGRDARQMVVCLASESTSFAERCSFSTGTAAENGSRMARLGRCFLPREGSPGAGV